MAAPRHLRAAGPAARTSNASGKCPWGGRDRGGQRVGNEHGGPLPGAATSGSGQPWGAACLRSWSVVRSPPARLHPCPHPSCCPTQGRCQAAALRAAGTAAPTQVLSSQLQGEDLLTCSLGMGREGGGRCWDPTVLPGTGTVLGVRPGQPAKLPWGSAPGAPIPREDDPVLLWFGDSPHHPHVGPGGDFAHIVSHTSKELQTPRAWASIHRSEGWDGWRVQEARTMRGVLPIPGQTHGDAGTEPPLKWGGHGAVALLEQCAVSLAATPANPS